MRKNQDAPAPGPELLKRSMSITVKLSKEDFSFLKECSNMFWPGAHLSNSSMLLSFAKIGAKFCKDRNDESHQHKL